MAACGGIQHIFESPALPDTPALIDTISQWKNKAIEIDKPSLPFTDIFGELRFKEGPEPPSLFRHPIPMPKVLPAPITIEDSKFDEGETCSIGSSAPSTPKSDYSSASHQKSDSFSSMNSESLQMCTEGLGFESFDDVEDHGLEADENFTFKEEKRWRGSSSGRICREFRRSRSMGGGFPPPIPSISTTGKPWVCFKSYRHHGRFVLKEIRFPTQEILQVSREDGRLRLHLVQPNKDHKVLEEEDEDEPEEVEDKAMVEDRSSDRKEGLEAIHNRLSVLPP